MHPITNSLTAFVGRDGHVSVGIVFNFLPLSKGRVFERRPHMRDLHECLGIHRVEAKGMDMPEAAITSLISSAYPKTLLHVHLNIEGVEELDLAPNIKALYRPLSCPLMSFAQGMAQTSVFYYRRARQNKNRLWKCAEMALEENLERHTKEVVTKETESYRVTEIEIEPNLPPVPASCKVLDLSILDKIQDPSIRESLIKRIQSGQVTSLDTIPQA